MAIQRNCEYCGNPPEEGLRWHRECSAEYHHRLNEGLCLECGEREAVLVNARKVACQQCRDEGYIPTCRNYPGSR